MARSILAAVRRIKSEVAHWLSPTDPRGVLRRRLHLARARARPGRHGPPVRAADPARQHGLRPRATAGRRPCQRRGVRPGPRPLAVGRFGAPAPGRRRSPARPDPRRRSVARSSHLPGRRVERVDARYARVANALRPARHAEARMRLPGHACAGVVPRRHRPADPGRGRAASDARHVAASARCIRS